MLTKNGKAYLFPGNAIPEGATVNPRVGFWVGFEYEQTFSGDLGIKVICGSGDTTPTLDDYELDSKITTLTEVSNDPTEKATPRSYSQNLILSCTTVYQNNTGQDIEVKELGLVVTGYYDYLIARQLIAPKILKAGKTYALSMTIG